MVSKERGKAFLSELESLCRKYGISIEHEDGHGAFLLEEFSEHALNWLLDANYETYKES